MITLKKLRSLKSRTCVRKCASLFHQLSQEMDTSYLYGLLTLSEEQQFAEVLDEEQRKQLRSLIRRVPFVQGRDLAILLEDIHYFLLGVLGSEPSDWDLTDDQGALDVSARHILPHILVLDRLRSPYNIGSIFRSADSFGVQKIYLVEGCARLDHPRTIKTSRGCIATVDHEVLPEDVVLQRIQSLPLFALETGGTELSQFPFPREGVGIIGGEELGVSPSLLKASEASLGRLTLPMGGTKGSLNVAVATGIMLCSWYQITSPGWM
ncbi:MAG: TrmH family RNA methyltransferase [Sphaerochaetaceae bacterium]|nr:TrmH family RNA methyltransferase [uncultured Sphaerochaeta sp.]MDC7231536.1 TrmH family RNA methyltransferase [Sphaerochaetaceae bacterium]